MLKKEEKSKLIEELSDKLQRCTIAITTDYRGIASKDMVKLRRSLRNAKVDYQVAKNTLIKFAADKSGKEQIDSLLAGPMAVAFGYEDGVKAAKALNDAIVSSNLGVKITGGILDNKLMTAKDIIALASMPPREVLLAQLFGQLNAPIQGLHTVLNATISGFARVLQARVTQMEETSNTPA
jgi:large subunit ribosomal protein L10